VADQDTTPETERFRPGGVLHATLSGLIELALASVCLGVALELGERSAQAETSLIVAAVLWTVLAIWSLTTAARRALTDEAVLDADGVTLADLRGRHRLAWDELSGGRTRLVTRDGRRRRVRGVRGAAQGRRFRARVLARAEAAAASTTDAASTANGAAPDTLGPDRLGGGTGPQPADR
jgi:hypothetical protein